MSSLKAKIKSMEEVAMRWERHLSFLMQERDGYINVLKLYQPDSTADQQIKELQAEVITTEVCIISYIQIFLSAGEVSNSK